MGLGGISMHFQLVFNGIWNEFQLGLEGISVACGWMSMLAVWFSLHLGSTPMAFWMDFNAFWMDPKCILNGFRMHFEWIFNWFGMDYNAFSVDVQWNLE